MTNQRRKIGDLGKTKGTIKNTTESTNRNIKELVPLNSIKLNFRNKRIVTQFIRFIPDSIVDGVKRNNGNELQTEILDRVDDIPVNNVANSFWKIDTKRKNNDPLTSVEKVIDDYPRHYRSYDRINEGIFIGKRICFHNIQTKNQSLLNQLDEFVHLVNENGNSLINSELVEEPRLFKDGAMHTVLYGHQRLCYLIFKHGTEYDYPFDVTSRNLDKQDEIIFKENNTKKRETGYEQLVSAYFSFKELMNRQNVSFADMEDYLSGTKKCINNSGEDIDLTAMIIKELPLGRTKYFAHKPFFIDPRLLDAIKENQVGLSKDGIFEAYKQVKTSLKQLSKNTADKELVLSFFTDKLKSLNETLQKGTSNDLQTKPENKNNKRKKHEVNVKVPATTIMLDKLLFRDIREWSKTNIKDFDVTKKQGVKEYLNAVIDEINSEEN
jgi:hypothetical protein